MWAHQQARYQRSHLTILICSELDRLLASYRETCTLTDTACDEGVVIESKL